MHQTNYIVRYTGPNVIDALIDAAGTLVDTKWPVLRVVCEPHDCLIMATDYMRWDQEARVLIPDLNSRTPLNPAHRQDLCVIDRPQHFGNLPEFLIVDGGPVVLLCQPDHSDTHAEMDLSGYPRWDIPSLTPRLSLRLM